MKAITNERFDEERAFYGTDHMHMIDCSFDGPADGESAFKESQDIVIENCFFALRYPFWHDTALSISDSKMTDLCRAAIWYSNDVHVQRSDLHGIKAVRECGDVELKECDIVSAEFGWFTDRILLEDCTLKSEYPFMRASEVSFKNVSMNGKYSFQYVEGGCIEDSELKTKDAFWHAKDLTIRDCVIEGEYLAWYSEDLTFINCTIRGTQPFCYCKGLKLIDCVMEGADLAFERSEVDATILSPIESVKNPRAGRIVARSIGELILDDPACACELETNE